MNPRPTDFLIVDGYNLVLTSGLVKTLGGPGNLERARQRLLGWLASALDEPQRARTTVVFDAQKYTVERELERHEEMTVLYAMQHPSADALIGELIRHHSAPKQLVVVSSDREIQQMATHRGAQAVGSADWFEQIERQVSRGTSAREGLDPTDSDARERVAGGDPSALFPPEIITELHRAIEGSERGQDKPAAKNRPPKS